MAEVIGIVASGISIATLAVQIAGSIIELKSYWDEVKDAPEDIWLLIEELEELNMLLSTIRDNLQRDPISNTIAASIPASRCLDHCQRGARRLRELTDDLHADINASRGTKLRWASAKVVMRKDKIKRYKSRLESSIRLLSLSYQFYNSVLIQQQPDVIIAHLARQLNSSKLIEVPAVTATPSNSSDQSLLCSKTPVENNGTQSSLANNVDRTECRRRERVDRTRQLKILIKLINFAWEVELFRSRLGWTINLRTINYIPFESPIFHAIRGGDLEMIKALFKRREASINDVSDGGLTLIGTATYNLKSPIFKFLLHEGAESNPEDVYHIVANNFNLEDPTAQEQAIRLLIDNHDIDFPVLSLGSFRGSEEAFLALQNQTDTNYLNVPFGIRACIATGLARWPDINSPDLFRLALQPGPILPADVQEDSGQLIQAVAQAIGKIVCFITSNGPKPGASMRDDHVKDLADWRSILRELITKGADLNGTQVAICFYKEEEYISFFQTPFLSLFGTVHPEFMDSFPWNFDKALEIWLQDLQACRVNLLEYGSKEKAVHSQTSTAKHFASYIEFGAENFEGRSCIECRSWHLVDFTFGASPSDWHVEIAECPTKKCLLEYCGQTWLRSELGLEPEEKSIPGAWND